MFKNLIKDSKKANSSEESGGMKQIDIGSANTNVNTVDTNGSVLLDTGEELEEADIEAQTKEINGEEVVELGSEGEPIGDSLPEYTKINPYGPTAEKWLTESERKALQSQVDRFSEEDKESVKRVQAALASENYPSDISSLWTYLCKEREIFGRSMDEEEEMSEVEKDRKMTEKMREKGYNAEFSEKENKSIKELSGEEFKELMQEAQSDSTEEELESEAEEADEPAVKIEELEDSVKSEAASAFQERDKEYWHDIAEELQIDIPNTKVEPSEENGKKKLTTTNPTMIEELKRVHKSDEYDTSLEKKGEGHYVGVIPTGVQY